MYIQAERGCAFNHCSTWGGGLIIFGVGLSMISAGLLGQVVANLEKLMGFCYCMSFLRAEIELNEVSGSVEGRTLLPASSGCESNGGTTACSEALHPRSSGRHWHP